MTVCLAYPTGFELSQKFAKARANRQKVFVANFKCSSNTREAKVRKSESEQTEGIRGELQVFFEHAQGESSRQAKITDGRF